VSAKLNLASQPFRNRALPWTITATVAIVSVIALIFIFNRSSQINREALIVERDVQTLRQEAGILQQRAEEIKQSLTPEQRLTLDAAHTLVDRKRFSWSRLFADLEAALPGNVRVTSINVRQVGFYAGRTIADLELAVTGKDPSDVTQMISEMSRTGIFQADVLQQNLSKARGETGTEWVLSVRYTPRAGAPTTTEGTGAVATTTSSAPAVSNGGSQQ
jgi:Tfp pilus assembly protein PilN